MQCRFEHIDDVELTPLLLTSYERYLKSKFKFNTVELKRLQYCLNMALDLTEGNGNATLADLGPGRRLFSCVLAELGKNITDVDIKYYDGCDIEAADYQFIQSGLIDLEREFDYVFCFEVLEHNDLSQLGKNIEKIMSLAKKHAIISLPYYEDPIVTRDHKFTLNTNLINEFFEDWQKTILYRPQGFPYIYFTK